MSSIKVPLLFIVSLFSFSALANPELFTPEKPKKLKFLSEIKKYNDDKEGYMIITTNDLSHRLEKLQRFIACKAKVRKFRVFMATENNWSGQSEDGRIAKERGAPQGRTNGKDILHFLKKSYKPLNLKYVIFIGDARPDNGTTPMLRMHHHKDYKNFIRGEDQDKHPAKKLSRSDGRYTEWGEVISDYPYIDLDTDWDGDKDGFLEPIHDNNPQHTREAEVFVGRVPYYGENSKYGKAADVDIILDRFVRYDTEKDINWRYHILYQHGGQNAKVKEFCEEHGINYTLISRENKGKVVGLPALRSKHGGEHLENFEIIQDHGTAFFGTHSHGGPMGMEGLGSTHIAAVAQDRYPTILTLGACDIGQIQAPQNLIYTLLRFHTVAASGGTGSVTSYGGNHGYAVANGLDKDMLLMKGKSAGEAHWGWYGALYKNMKHIPMTGGKINLYGDPSATPLRYGSTPPYPFIAKPVAGHFEVAPGRQYISRIKPYTITLNNHKKKTAKIMARTNVKWLKVSPSKIMLSPGSDRKISVNINKSEAVRLKPGTYEAKVEFKATTGYVCERRYVLKINEDKIRAYYSFDKEEKSFHNEVGSYQRRMDHMNMPKSVIKFDPKSGGTKPIINAPGKYDNGVNLNHALSGYIYPFDKENVTMTFWLKFNSLPAGEKNIFSASNFFTLKKTNSGLSLKIKNHGLEGNKVVEKTLQGSLAWKANTWYHLAFTVDQKTGQVKIFANGQKLAEDSMPQHVTYATSSTSFAQVDGVLDELFIYNDNLSEKEIRGLAQGQYVERVLPKPKNNAVSPSGLVFDFKTGIDPKNMYVMYQAKGEKEKHRITPNDKGKFEPLHLKSNTIYNWKVLTKDKTFASKPFLFKTAAEMIPNGQFLEDTASWKGGERKLVKAGGKWDYNRMSIKGTTTTDLIGEIKANKFYSLTAKVDVPYYQYCVAKLYTISSTGRRELYKESQLWPSPAGKKDLNVNFFVDKKSPLVGKKLSLELNPGHGGKRAKEYWIGKLSMISFSPGSRNVPPILVKDLKDFKPTVKVGEVGWQVPLRKFARDPEKARLRYEVIRAPKWMYVQGDDTLFSNFGPPKEAVGEHKVVLVAIDPDNGKLEFEFTVKAVN